MANAYTSAGLKAFLITFLCIVGVAFIVGGISYSAGMWGGTNIPDVIGLSQKEAVSVLGELGFSCEISEEASDEEEGSVVNTDPPVGTRVETTNPITLFVATPRKVTDVCGMSIEEAKAALTDLGFTNIETVEKISDDETGKVLSQDPLSGSNAKGYDLISLTVASPHTIPDVSDMSEADAKSKMEDAGYKYYVTQEYSDEIQEGHVISTVPKSGEVYAASETVEIIVAKSRSNELVEIAEKYLKSLSRVAINGKTYEISKVDSVRFDHDSTCKFTISARQYESHSWFGGEEELRYGNYEQIEGSVSINDNNEVESTDPNMTSV